MPTTHEPRILIHWDRTPHLQILKMLAWVIFDREHIRNPAKLEIRVATLLGPVVETITGEQGITLQTVKDDTLAEQGAPITAAKLLQRADKTDRYVEWNEYVENVEAAYVWVTAIWCGDSVSTK